MKKTLSPLPHLFTLLIASTLCFNGYAQLPDDFITKVSYHEKKEVIYSLPSEEDIGCLTLSELSQYHGYMQFYRIDEYVDSDGDLLTDQNFIEERHVRDEWMEGYSRILVGKNTIDIYNTDKVLCSKIPRERDSNTVLLSPEQAQKFGYHNLNLDYFDQLVAEFHVLGLVVSHYGNRLTATGSFMSFTYDHDSKVLSATEYDSSGQKTRESVIQFQLTQREDTYFPETETTIEWLRGKNGCCIRKTTIRTRYKYKREVREGSGPARQDSENDHALNSSSTHSDFTISLEKNRNAFRIESKRIWNRMLDVIIYDMAGKKVLQERVRIGEPVLMPSTSRTGMYLVHIVSNKKGHPVTGKIIITGNGEKF